MGDVRFTGNWNSVNAHTVPKWYEDCKFGIFIHWGIYSVPAFAPHTWELGEVDSKEWFADNPYSKGVVKGIRKGTAVITVQSGAKKLNCKITVK